MANSKAHASRVCTNKRIVAQESKLFDDAASVIEGDLRGSVVPDWLMWLQIFVFKNERDCYFSVWMRYMINSAAVCEQCLNVIV